MHNPDPLYGGAELLFPGYLWLLFQELAPHSCLLTFELDLHHLASVLQDVPIGLKCVTGTMDADLQAQVGL